MAHALDLPRTLLADGQLLAEKIEARLASLQQVCPIFLCAFASNENANIEVCWFGMSVSCTRQAANSCPGLGP